MLDQGKRRAKIFLLVGICLMLISMIGASAVQTSGGRVTMKELSFETPMGLTMSGWLLVPDGVSAENPAPAIITCHGMFNNRGMQDLNWVELSRRGFVVFAMDMFSHGNSQSVDGTRTILQSMNQAVEMISRLNYVDSSRIGITGHSLGGMSSNIAVGIDNGREVPLIASVLVNSADATYAVEGKFVNIYGSRHVGIVAPQYEEFFMLDRDEAGNVTAPRYFVYHNNAQSFLHFGQNPEGLAQRSANTIYREVIDGREAMRVIYAPAILHPWAHFSSRVTNGTIEFFNATLGAPNPISPSNQVWQWKVFFNLLGLVGAVMFMIKFVILMTFTRFFESLRATEVVQPRVLKKGGAIWFFITLAAGAIFGVLTYLPILKGTEAFRHSTESFRQTQVFGLATWALACGLFALVVMAVYYFVYGRKNEFSFKERGITISIRNLGKTFLLAIFGASMFFGWVFFADYFFQTDFRFWIIAVRPFTAARLLYALVPYMLFFVIFFVANSLSLTAFNYNSIGKKKWVNTLIVAAFNVFPAAILLIIQYSTFIATGFLFFGDHANAAQGPYHMFSVWLFPFLVILTITPVIARKIYRMTNNPYLPGLINGIIVTLMAAANTLTWS